ncbi:hypothetical protein MGYG_00451 [Nannizzia gypsea CBS 118893]|uniref:Uncharacterized protein n=1 Tax=Arthroderma gypseum (strain ATCC MYA-4604 / CBS 118893) TaxID=535722 RepID=E5QZU8_ARTGP|nr:hypothetical protein MGYG_00451 [Nannizzia gypsea CBS 118893]EFQ97411.1 hypothetical protein MGYG_00451 [Nannizzia gypsea CBS 118893]
MRFLVSSILAIALASTNVIASPSLSCLKIPTMVQSYDPAKIGAIFQKEICGQGCDFRASNYDTQIKDVVKKCVADESTAMGAPTLSPYYINLADAMFQTVSEKCSEGQYRDVNLCSVEPEVLTQVLGCFKSSALSTLWAQKSNVLPLLTTNCEEQYKHFTVDNLYNKILPACAQKFAAEHCKAA